MLVLISVGLTELLERSNVVRYWITMYIKYKVLRYKPIHRNIVLSFLDLNIFSYNIKDNSNSEKWEQLHFVQPVFNIRLLYVHYFIFLDLRWGIRSLFFILYLELREK